MRLAFTFIVQTLKPFKGIAFIPNICTKNVVVSLCSLHVFITISRQLVLISLVLRLCCQVLTISMRHAHPWGASLSIAWGIPWGYGDVFIWLTHVHKIHIIFPLVLLKRIYFYTRHPTNKRLYFSFSIAVFASTIMALSENMD